MVPGCLAGCGLSRGRWFYWAVSMCPFMYVLYELYFGLAEATKKHAPTVASLIASARYVTAISWLTYPFVSASRANP